MSYAQTRNRLKTYSRKRARTVNASESPGSSPPRAPTPSSQKGRLKPSEDANIAQASTSPKDSPSPRPRKRSRMLTDSVPSTEPRSSVLHPSAISLTHQMPTSPTKLSSAVLPQKEHNNHRTLALITECPLSVNAVDPPVHIQLPKARATTMKPKSFKRTKSQTQKENVLCQPPALGPPIQISSNKTDLLSRTSARLTQKPSRASAFSRKASDNVRESHMSTSADSFHRRSSGSHVLQTKSAQYQEWLVPISSAAVGASISVRKKQGNPSLLPEQDICDSFNFIHFSPQGASTPLPLGYKILPPNPMPTTPTTPLAHGGTNLASEMVRKNGDEDIVMKDSTPEVIEHVSDKSKLQEIEERSEAKSETSRRTVHIPHDSIFSSFDISASLQDTSTPESPRSHGNSKTTKCKDSKQEKSPPISQDGNNRDNTLNSRDKDNNLHDMLSGLGLSDKTAKWKKSQDSGIALDAPTGVPKIDEKQKASNVSKEKKVVRIITKSNANPVSASANESDHERRNAPKDCSKARVRSILRVNQGLPKPQLHLDNEPLIAEEEEDELLLTSKGWDWRPLRD